ncbi:hypothetical protein L873DRAFT_1788867 [Choiromyces venosus 120613-1]|uniref:Uncharacterized protein n=1 Tax=Choiromyces venosus 120613-1 TaxID=1336337 RepID=A0A3N4JR96_9PEZI|nr:hypothetical protein L873DRAFT_1788867 [Choiromyces venosus 120613-1]
MDRRYLRPAHSYKIFRDDCGFTIEDWTSFHERVQTVLLQPRNYVALQKPHMHREAWEGWLQRFMDTGLADVYWSIKSGKKWNIVENGEVIRAFVRDVVIALGTEICRARNKIAREANYFKNIEPPEYPAPARIHPDDPKPSSRYRVIPQARSKAPGTTGKRPHPSSVPKVKKTAEISSVVKYVPRTPASSSASLPPPPALPTPSPSEPPVKLLPVREVVDIEKYDPDSPIELIPEGYVKQFVIDDNDEGHHKVILLEDPSYNGNRPNKRRAKERFEIPNRLPSNDVSTKWPSHMTSSSPMLPTPKPYLPCGSHDNTAEIPARLPRLVFYNSTSRDQTPVPLEGEGAWGVKREEGAVSVNIGIKTEIPWEDGDDEEENDHYRRDDEEEAGYTGRGGTETDTDGECGFAGGVDICPTDFKGWR